MAQTTLKFNGSVDISGSGTATASFTGTATYTATATVIERETEGKSKYEHHINYSLSSITVSPSSSSAPITYTPSQSYWSDTDSRTLPKFTYITSAESTRNKKYFYGYTKADTNKVNRIEGKNFDSLALFLSAVGSEGRVYTYFSGSASSWSGSYSVPAPSSSKFSFTAPNTTILFLGVPFTPSTALQPVNKTATASNSVDVESTHSFGSSCSIILDYGLSNPVGDHIPTVTFDSGCINLVDNALQFKKYAKATYASDDKPVEVIVDPKTTSDDYQSYSYQWQYSTDGSTWTSVSAEDCKNDPIPTTDSNGKIHYVTHYFTGGQIVAINPTNKYVYVRFMVTTSPGQTVLYSENLFNTNDYYYYAKLSVNTLIIPDWTNPSADISSTVSNLGTVYFGIPILKIDETTKEETITLAVSTDYDDTNTNTAVNMDEQLNGYCVSDAALISSKLKWVEGQQRYNYWYYTKPVFTFFARPANDGNNVPIVEIVGALIADKGAIELIPINQEAELPKLTVGSGNAQTDYYYQTFTTGRTLTADDKNGLAVQFTCKDAWGRSSQSSVFNFLVYEPPKLSIADVTTGQRVRQIEVSKTDSFFTESLTTGEYLRFKYEAVIPTYDETTHAFPIIGDDKTVKVKMRMYQLDDNGSKKGEALTFKGYVRQGNAYDIVDELPLTTQYKLNPDDEEEEPEEWMMLFYLSKDNGKTYNPTLAPRYSSDLDSSLYKLSTQNGYVVEARITDCGRKNTLWTEVLRLTKATPSIHFAGSGHGIGFGTFVDDSSEDNPKFVNEFVTTMNIPTIAVQANKGTHSLTADGILNEDGSRNSAVDTIWPAPTGVTNGMQTAAIFHNYTILKMRPSDYANYKANSTSPYGFDSNLIVFIVDGNPEVNKDTNNESQGGT